MRQKIETTTSVICRYLFTPLIGILTCHDISYNFKTFGTIKKDTHNHKHMHECMIVWEKDPKTFLRIYLKIRRRERNIPTFKYYAIFVMYA